MKKIFWIFLFFMLIHGKGYAGWADKLQQGLDAVNKSAQTVNDTKKNSSSQDQPQINTTVNKPQSQQQPKQQSQDIKQSQSIQDSAQAPSRSQSAANIKNETSPKTTNPTAVENNQSPNTQVGTNTSNENQPLTDTEILIVGKYQGYGAYRENYLAKDIIDTHVIETDDRKKRYYLKNFPVDEYHLKSYEVVAVLVKNVFHNKERGVYLCEFSGWDKNFIAKKQQEKNDALAKQEEERQKQEIEGQKPFSERKLYVPTPAGWEKSDITVQEFCDALQGNKVWEPTNDGGKILRITIDDQLTQRSNKTDILFSCEDSKVLLKRLVANGAELNDAELMAFWSQVISSVKTKKN